jgi:hypothetical protein
VALRPAIPIPTAEPMPARKAANATPKKAIPIVI